MNLFKSLLVVGLVGVISGVAPLQVFADEFTPTLSIITNTESIYYKRDDSGEKTIWKAPLLRMRTNVNPYTSYWAHHFYEIHGIKGKSPERLSFYRSVITEFVTKNMPAITEDYIKDRNLDYAVDGSDLCYPASKGVPFKVLAESIEAVTALPYHGKLCVISDTTKSNMIDGYRISILDDKTGRELHSFTQRDDSKEFLNPWGQLQWVDDRYIIQTFSARRYTCVNLIDLNLNKITFRIESDAKELISAFVLNGKVMFLNDGALVEYPLKH